MNTNSWFYDDRDGFFRQICEAVLSLSKEPTATVVFQSGINVAHDNSATPDAEDTPPTKKLNISPFDWFPRASAATLVTSVSTTPAPGILPEAWGYKGFNSVGQSTRLA